MINRSTDHKYRSSSDEKTFKFPVKKRAKERGKNEQHKIWRFQRIKNHSQGIQKGETFHRGQGVLKIVKEAQDKMEYVEII